VTFRFFTIDGLKVIETEPIKTKTGEVIYFKDFNKDGSLELVLTDCERYFLYSAKGYPITPFVWIYDSDYKLWWKANMMITGE
jgi:hypothetical protein